MTGVPGTVGRPGLTLPRAPGRLKTEKPSRLDAINVPPVALRATAFFALAFFAAAHWAALVEPQQTGRALVVTIVATTCGLLIALSGRLPRVPGVVMRVLLVLAALVIATTAMGIRFKLLKPAGWDTLHDRVSGGLSVVGGVTEWPYKGPNAWLRLTALLPVPLVLVPAAAAAFWPRRRDDGSIGRAIALVLLVALYAVAVAARPFDHQALRGIGLLACLAAWLWLPRLRGRDAAAAAAAIGVAAIVALFLTPQVASRQPWVDYRHWSWTLHKEKTIGFDWRHSYGPLHWPRKGTTLMLIKSKNPHYWKAESLDRFDGRGWTTSPLRDSNPSYVNRRLSGNPKWIETVRVTMRGLRSDVVIGPGSIISADQLPSQPMFLGNQVALFNDQLGSGDSYTATGYTPDPTVKQMRNAPTPSAPLGYYTTIQLPEPGGFVSTFVHMPVRGRPYTGDPDAVQRLERSRYADVYALAKQITANASTQYDMVRSIGGYLEEKYKYSENVPQHAYPIEAFLFKDKKGYCQHFAGAAALMLRMLGVPVRVASGFAPGTLDNKTHEYVVTDLDAHSWIEVWFEGIGWVPFDPTPAQAPASSQAAFTPLSEIASAARGNAKDKLPAKLREQFIGGGGGGGAAAAADSGGTPWAWIAGGIVVALLGVAAILVSVLRLRRGRHALPPPCGDAEVDHLVRLLARAGLEIPAGTTLLGLEARMERLGGPDVAGYAQRLRRRRFGHSDEPPPDRAARRKLRHAVAEAIGAGPLSRLHLAMPDNGVMRSGALKLRRLRRSR
ncbi:MAG TPA: transglutaminase domain-containing protein [Thermoleophilaceae bacterium]